MAELTEYTVMINGIPHTMMLDAETAARYGDLAVKVGKAPQNKARQTVSNKGAPRP